MAFPALAAMGAADQRVHADGRPSRDNISKLASAVQDSETMLGIGLQITSAGNTTSRGTQRNGRREDCCALDGILTVDVQTGVILNWRYQAKPLIVLAFHQKSG
jgi:predicted amino acid racemase